MLTTADKVSGGLGITGIILALLFAFFLFRHSAPDTSKIVFAHEDSLQQVWAHEKGLLITNANDQARKIDSVGKLIELAQVEKQAIETMLKAQIVKLRIEKAGLLLSQSDSIIHSSTDSARSIAIIAKSDSINSEKRILESCESQRLKMSVQLSMKDSIILDYRKSLDIYSAISASKSFELSALTDDFKKEKKEIRKQKASKFISWAAGGLGIVYLLFRPVALK